MKKKLSTLMEGYFTESATSRKRPQFLDGLILNEDIDLPISAQGSFWATEQDPERLVRTFTFSSVGLRNYFLSELLSYEEEYGHHGRICIEGLNVTAEVYTHDLQRVTELDQDYADQCDAIFSDMELWNR